MSKEQTLTAAKPSELSALLGAHWQPIENAPLREAVLVHHEAYWASLACKLEDGVWYRWRSPVGNEPLGYTPSHWLPWPDSPMCHGQGWCMHGDGEVRCPHCNGSGVMTPNAEINPRVCRERKPE